MHAHDTHRTSHERVSARRSSRPAGTPPIPLLALQRAAGNAAVVRAIEKERHEHGAGCGHDQPVQRSSVLNVLGTPGAPVDPVIRAKAERGMGTYLGDVVVHTGAAARRSAAELGARAYTSGRHIVVGEGGNDEHTMLHELAHAWQQQQGPVAGTENGGGLSVSHEDDRDEKEAEAWAHRLKNTSGQAQATARPDGDEHTAAAPVQVPAVQRMPSRRPLRREDVPPQDEMIEMRRTRADRLVRRAGGVPIPRDSSNDSHLAELWDEADQQLQNVRIVEARNGQPAQAHRSRDGYHISYDPGYVTDPYNGDTVEPRHYATASLLHEAHHVRSDYAYRRPADPDQALAFTNFHLPRQGGVDGRPLMESMQRQARHGDQNLEHARTIISRDRQLGSRMREHLLSRLDYAQGSGPAVHYDTVLADMLQYMYMMGADGTESYRYLRRLSREAHGRRNNLSRDYDELREIRPS